MRGSAQSRGGLRKLTQTHCLDIAESRITIAVTTDGSTGISIQSIAVESEEELVAVERRRRIRSAGRRLRGALGSARTRALHLLQTQLGAKLRSRNE